MDSIDISRRQTLGTLGASGALALAGCLGDGEDDSGDDNNGTTTDDFDGLRIGVLAALTGPNGPEFGHNTITGFLSSLAYKNGENEVPPTNPPLDMEGDAPIEAIDGETLSYTVNGTEFEMHIRDTEDKPRPSAAAGISLVNDENVDLLYGVSNSDAVLRVIRQVVRVTGVPLMVSTASVAEATSSGETCDRRVFRATGTSAMSANVGARYIDDQDDLESVAIFAEDYSFGRSVATHYRDAFEELGVEIVTNADEEIFPRGYTEWRPEIDEVANAGADVIVYGFTSQTGVQFFQDFTTDDQGNPDIASLKVIGDMPTSKSLAQLGDSIAQRLEELPIELTLEQALNLVDFGPLTTRYFWNQYENPINNHFVDVSREAYNINPDMFSGDAHATGSAVAQAIEEQGEATSEAIIEGVYEMTVQDTVKGEGQYVFQGYNNQARSPMTIAPIKVTPQEGDDNYSEAEDGNWEPTLKPGEPVFTADKDDVTIKPDSRHMTCNF